MKTQSEISNELLLKDKDEYYMILSELKNVKDTRDSDRQFGIVTFIDNQIYEVLSNSFFDTENRMIIIYDKLTNQIDYDDISYEYNITRDKFFFNFKSNNIVRKVILLNAIYETQYERMDLTEEFIDKEKPKQLKNK